MASIHIDRGDSPTFLNSMTRDEAEAAFVFPTIDDDKELVSMLDQIEYEESYREDFEQEVFEAASRSSFYRSMKDARREASFREVFEMKLVIEASKRSTFVARILDATVPF